MLDIFGVIVTVKVVPVGVKAIVWEFHCVHGASLNWRLTCISLATVALASKLKVYDSPAVTEKLTGLVSVCQKGPVATV